jgi:hypothetical protein
LNEGPVEVIRPFLLAGATTGGMFDRLRRTDTRNSSWSGELISTQRPNTFAQTCLLGQTYPLQSRGGPYIPVTYFRSFNYLGYFINDEE